MNLGNYDSFADDTMKGQIKIDNHILYGIVRSATKEVEGVRKITNTLCGNIKKMFTRGYEGGLKIKNTLDGVVIDIYLEIELQKKINDLAYEVQKNIKNSLSTMLDINVSKINVNIVNVHIKNDDVNSNEKEEKEEKEESNE